MEDAGSTPASSTKVVFVDINGVVRQRGLMKLMESPGKMHRGELGISITLMGLLWIRLCMYFDQAAREMT